jgi:DNA polymerase-3 subunit epsilon
MFNSLTQWYYRKQLKEARYSFLFEPPTDDKVVCFDCETTGLNPKTAELVSIGAVKIANNVVLTSERLELFIEQNQSINEDSIKIHQLRQCDLIGELNANQAIENFLHFLGSRPIVGYFLEFDVAMINKYLKPLLGIKLPNQQIEVSQLYYKKKYHPFRQHQPIDLSFEAILNDLDIPKLGKHDAFNDALMTAMMYLKLRA